MKHRTGYLFSRNGVYYLRWKAGGKAFTQSLETRSIREARKKQARIMAPIAVADREEVLQAVVARLGASQEGAAAGSFDGVSIAEAWDVFLQAPERPDTGPRTLADYAAIWKQFADWIRNEHPILTRLDQVRYETANHYAAHLRDRGISANRYNKHVQLLAMAFRVIRRRAGLRDNPWADIKRRRVIQQGRRELTIAELEKICRSAAGELRVLLGIGIYTGLRLGDCATLRWAEVDMARGIITRIPNKTAARNPRPVIAPIHPALAALLGPQQTNGPVLSGMAAKYVSDRTGLVRSIQAHFRRCGIETHRPAAEGQSRPVVAVGFHSLRHTFVSLCRAAGAPLAVVESLVGHSSPAMTRHYTHVGAEAARAAVALIPSVTTQPGASARSPSKRPSQ